MNDDDGVRKALVAEILLPQIIAPGHEVKVNVKFNTEGPEDFEHIMIGIGKIKSHVVREGIKQLFGRGAKTIVEELQR